MTEKETLTGTRTHKRRYTYIWRRIDQKTGKQWHNMDTKDAWRALRRLKARWKGRLPLLKVEAHQDRRKNDSCMADPLHTRYKTWWWIS
jgi:hypothetical protein